jgi:hypothetical protein
MPDAAAIKRSIVLKIFYLAGKADLLPGPTRPRPWRKPLKIKYKIDINYALLDRKDADRF